MNDWKTNAVKLVGGAMGLRSTVEVTKVAESGHDPVIDFVASDSTLDRDGEVIEPSGWMLDNFIRNPVFQNSHQYGDIQHTLGKAIKVGIGRRNGQPALFMSIRFAVDANPVAKIAYDLYKGGFLTAVSVGFLPIEWRDGVTMANGQRVKRLYSKAELLELSAVAIPANPNALVSGKSGYAGGTAIGRQFARVEQALDRLKVAARGW